MHYDILPKQQALLYPELAPTKDLGYVLYGGTAIALHLGNRRSVDFDFFSDRQFLPHEVLAERMPFLDNAAIMRIDKNTLSYQTEHGVRLSFFTEIGFGRIGGPAADDRNTLVLASPLDLLATKCKVILQRVEAKDYHDISALLTAGLTLRQGIEGAMALYGKSFSALEAIKSISWFEDGDLASVTKSERKHLESATSNLLKEIRMAPLQPLPVLSKTLS